jgi:hypothetical protein
MMTTMVVVAVVVVVMEIPLTLPAWFGRFFSVSLGASPGYVWLSQLPMLCFFSRSTGDNQLSVPANLRTIASTTLKSCVNCVTAA